jgi:hypothetical protein
VNWSIPVEVTGVAGTVCTAFEVRAGSRRLSTAKRWNCSFVIKKFGSPSRLNSNWPHGNELNIFVLVMIRIGGINISQWISDEVQWGVEPQLGKRGGVGEL